MLIRFTQDIEHEVVETYDEESDHAETRNEIFKSGQEFDVDIVGSYEASSDIQFGDGSVAYSVPNECFQIPFMAIFRPQSHWCSPLNSSSGALTVDSAINVGGKVEFEATKKLLSLSLDDIKDFQENNYDSDSLADGLESRENHNGPFEVDTELDEWLKVNGVEDRSFMTQKQLDKLRDKFGVKE